MDALRESSAAVSSAGSPGSGGSLATDSVAGVDSASESSACSGSEHSDDVSGGDLQELVELDTSVNLLFEWFSFGSLRGLGSSKFFLDRGHI